MKLFLLILELFLLILGGWVAVSVIAAPLVGAFIRAGRGPDPQDRINYAENGGEEHG